ncbi:MAG: hypothetical protein OXC27_01895, partial [Caldilineaceae bacterium]|nr:hypothetical protein [Caldilineaceae bacterium]
GIWLMTASVLEPHGWNEHTWSVSDGFVGGRCGGAAPAQGRAEGPTAHIKMRPTVLSRGAEEFQIGARRIVKPI